MLHLHVGGQVIATSAEHPFYASNRGWVPAGSLAEGDRLLGERGEWVPVEEVSDTGDHATLYNLRIADWHTYFVGEESWGWAAWAHNRECSVTTEKRNGKDVHVLRDPDGNEIASGDNKDALIAQGKALDAERAAGVAPSKPIGFAQGTANDAVRNVGRIDHGGRHLSDYGVISGEKQTKTFREAVHSNAVRILENPLKTFDHVIFGQRVKGFYGMIDGKKVVFFVAKEVRGKIGIGELVTAVVPSPQQIINWGL